MRRRGYDDGGKHLRHSSRVVDAYVVVVSYNTLPHILINTIVIHSSC